MTTGMGERQSAGLSDRKLAPEHRRAVLSSSLLVNLEPNRQEALLHLGVVRNWKRGEFLFLDGAPVDAIFYLLKGKAREYYCNGTGCEFQRGLLHAGCHVSLHNVFHQKQRHTNTCQALTAVTAFVWPSASFIEYLRRCPELGVQVATILAGSLESSCRRNCLCRKVGARSRIAGYLLSRFCVDCEQSHGCGGKTPSCPIDLRPLTHAAEDINLARETFSRTLVTLHDQGIISCHRGMVVIHDLEALKNISGVE